MLPPGPRRGGATTPTPAWTSTNVGSPGRRGKSQSAALPTSSGLSTAAPASGGTDTAMDSNDESLQGSSQKSQQQAGSQETNLLDDDVMDHEEHPEQSEESDSNVPLAMPEKTITPQTSAPSSTSGQKPATSAPGGKQAETSGSLDWARDAEDRDRRISSKPVRAADRRKEAQGEECSCCCGSGHGRAIRRKRSHPLPPPAITVDLLTTATHIIRHHAMAPSRPPYPSATTTATAATARPLPLPTHPGQEAFARRQAAHCDRRRPPPPNLRNIKRESGGSQVGGAEGEAEGSEVGPGERMMTNSKRATGRENRQALSHRRNVTIGEDADGRG